MSHKAEFVLTSLQNWNKIPGSTIEEMARWFVERLEEIRDPKSGELAQVTWRHVEDGVEILVCGSEYVCAEARQRMSTLEHS